MSCLAFIASMLLVGGEPDLKTVNFKARFGTFEGCFVMREVGGREVARYNEKGCELRLPPCSTFKILNSLAGLETGAVTGPDMPLKWDGTPQRLKGWEHDHTLASAIRESCVWYFQEVARRIGAERMKEYLAGCHYGNQDISGGLDKFWLGNSLTISAYEQLQFIEKLYSDKLPFRKKTMATVRDLIVIDKADGWVFSGKTGSSAPKNGSSIGWFVGHVQQGKRQYVFVMNTRGKDANGPRTRDIARIVLADMGLLPST